MTLLHNPKQNLILAALPADEFRRLSPHLELVPMPINGSYYESGGKLQHVYFPTTSVVSLRYVMESGAPAEIAGVGNEGMLGISVFMGAKALPKQAFMQTGGYGYRLKARLLLEEFNRAETLQHLLIRYTKALITQASQTVVCNRYHSVEQKLCRWLLLNLDHISSESDDSAMTQELLANSLGIRHDALTEALRKLQQAGFVRCHNGHITVLNRSCLEDQACECYSMIKAKLDSLLELGLSKPMPESARAWSKARNTDAPRVLYGAS